MIVVGCDVSHEIILTRADLESTLNVQLKINSIHNAVHPISERRASIPLQLSMTAYSNTFNYLTVFQRIDDTEQSCQSVTNRLADSEELPQDKLATVYKCDVKCPVNWFSSGGTFSSGIVIVFICPKAGGLGIIAFASIPLPTVTLFRPPKV